MGKDTGISGGIGGFNWSMKADTGSEAKSGFFPNLRLKLFGTRKKEAQVYNRTADNNLVVGRPTTALNLSKLAKVHNGTTPRIASSNGGNGPTPATSHNASPVTTTPATVPSQTTTQRSGNRTRASSLTQAVANSTTANRRHSLSRTPTSLAGTAISDPMLEAAGILRTVATDLTAIENKTKDLPAITDSYERAKATQETQDAINSALGTLRDLRHALPQSDNASNMRSSIEVMETRLAKQLIISELADLGRAADGTAGLKEEDGDQEAAAIQEEIDALRPDVLDEIARQRLLMKAGVIAKDGSQIGPKQKQLLALEEQKRGLANLDTTYFKRRMPTPALVDLAVRKLATALRTTVHNDGHTSEIGDHTDPAEIVRGFARLGSLRDDIESGSKQAQNNAARSLAVMADQLGNREISPATTDNSAALKQLALDLKLTGATPDQKATIQLQATIDDAKTKLAAFLEEKGKTKLSSALLRGARIDSRLAMAIRQSDRGKDVSLLVARIALYETKLDRKQGVAQTGEDKLRQKLTDSRTNLRQLRRDPQLQKHPTEVLRKALESQNSIITGLSEDQETDQLKLANSLYLVAKFQGEVAVAPEAKNKDTLKALQQTVTDLTKQVDNRQRDIKQRVSLVARIENEIRVRGAIRMNENIINDSEQALAKLQQSGRGGNIGLNAHDLKNLGLDKANIREIESDTKKLFSKGLINTEQAKKATDSLRKAVSVVVDRSWLGKRLNRSVTAGQARFGRETAPGRFADSYLEIALRDATNTRTGALPNVESDVVGEAFKAKLQNLNSRLGGPSATQAPLYSLRGSAADLDEIHNQLAGATGDLTTARRSIDEAYDELEDLGFKVRGKTLKDLKGTNSTAKAAAALAWDERVQSIKRQIGDHMQSTGVSGDQLAMAKPPLTRELSRLQDLNKALGYARAKRLQSLGDISRYKPDRLRRTGFGQTNAQLMTQLRQHKTKVQAYNKLTRNLDRQAAAVSNIQDLHDQWNDGLNWRKEAIEAHSDTDYRELKTAIRAAALSFKPKGQSISEFDPSEHFQDVTQRLQGWGVDTQTFAPEIRATLLGEMTDAQLETWHDELPGRKAGTIEDLINSMRTLNNGSSVRLDAGWGITADSGDVPVGHLAFLRVGASVGGGRHGAIRVKRGTQGDRIDVDFLVGHDRKAGIRGKISASFAALAAKADYAGYTLRGVRLVHRGPDMTEKAASLLRSLEKPDSVNNKTIHAADEIMLILENKNTGTISLEAETTLDQMKQTASAFSPAASIKGTSVADVPVPELSPGVSYQYARQSRTADNASLLIVDKETQHTITGSIGLQLFSNIFNPLDFGVGKGLKKAGVQQGANQVFGVKDNKPNDNLSSPVQATELLGIEHSRSFSWVSKTKSVLDRTSGQAQLIHRERRTFRPFGGPTTLSRAMGISLAGGRSLGRKVDEAKEIVADRDAAAEKRAAAQDFLDRLNGIAKDPKRGANDGFVVRETLSPKALALYNKANEEMRVARSRGDIAAEKKHQTLMDQITAKDENYDATEVYILSVQNTAKTQGFGARFIAFDAFASGQYEQDPVQEERLIVPDFNASDQPPPTTPTLTSSVIQAHVPPLNTTVRQASTTTSSLHPPQINTGATHDKKLALLLQNHLYEKDRAVLLDYAKPTSQNLRTPGKVDGPFYQEVQRGLNCGKHALNAYVGGAAVADTDQLTAFGAVNRLLGHQGDYADRNTVDTELGNDADILRTYLNWSVANDDLQHLGPVQTTAISSDKEALEYRPTGDRCIIQTHSENASHFVAFRQDAQNKWHLIDSIHSKDDPQPIMTPQHYIRQQIKRQSHNTAILIIEPASSAPRGKSELAQAMLIDEAASLHHNARTHLEARVDKAAMSLSDNMSLREMVRDQRNRVEDIRTSDSSRVFDLYDLGKYTARQAREDLANSFLAKQRPQLSPNQRGKIITADWLNSLENNNKLDADKFDPRTENQIIEQAVLATINN